MNIRLKGRLNTVFICGTVIVLAFLVACDPPAQPRPRVQEQLLEPNFQPRGTEITRGESVTIFARSGATIHYTMDGTDPTTTGSGSTISGPTPQPVNFRFFRVGDRVTVKAIATMEGFRASPIRSELFTIVEPDVDENNNGLIDIKDLNMLYNMRYNLEGTSYKTSENETGSIVGAPTPEEAARTGYMCTDRTAPNRLCGYELTRDLDFARRDDYSFRVMEMDWRPTGNNPDAAGNAGFPGIGAESGTGEGFTAIFNGKGHTIKNLYSRNTTSTGNNVGLFRLLGSGAVIRDVGVIDAGVYGGSGGDDRVGGLVGYNNGGRIIVSHATGNANGGAGNSDRVGGLVGYNNGGTITASYATGNADGGDGNNDRVGGLLGQNEDGVLTAIFATGNVDGGADNDQVGGLVGENTGAIRASYATGNVGGGAGDDQVGGLVGVNTDSGTIIASYASGDPDGGSGTGDTVGTLAGENTGTVTDSYAFGSSSNGENPGESGSDRPRTSSGALIHSASSLSAGNVGSSWNSATDGTAGAWSFGETRDVPALAYADYDGPGDGYSCDDYPDEIPGDDTNLECGDSNATLVGGFRPIPDTPGVTVSETTRILTVGENGGTATYEIRLSTQPTQQVTVTPQITPDDVVTVGPNSLTFTDADWDSMKEFTVTGVNNNIDHPANQMVTITHDVESADAAYNELSDGVGSVRVTATDDDTAGITVNPTTSHTVTEGNTTNYTVVLDSEPSDDVTVTIAGVNASRASLDNDSLTFTPTGGTSPWNVAQTVMVTATSNDVDDGDTTFMLTHAATGGGYNIAAADGPAVSVTVEDNDTAGIVFDPTGRTVSVAEGAAAVMYTVELASEPTDDVTVTVAGDISDSRATVTVGSGEGSTLTFTDSTWSTPQMVTVIPVDNIVVDGTATLTLTHAAESEDDDNYDIVAADATNVTVTVTDDDIDSDNDGTIDALDIDEDNDGLIEIHNLDMLDNIRHNLAGTNYKTSGSDSGSSTGAPTMPPPNCAGRIPATTLCGYELMQNLDFAIAAHYALESVNSAWRPNNANTDLAGNAGFNGIGPATGTTGGFSGIFEGNSHSINNLYSRASNSNRRNVGLFRLLDSDGVIRNVGVTAANVYGGNSYGDHVAPLVGYNAGAITASYATGKASSGGGQGDRVGGLVGYNKAGATITASYASSRADGGVGRDDAIGGLVGLNWGIITASYATGIANGGSGESDDVGGLVGENNGPITDSYATGNVDGGVGNLDTVGGLVGWNKNNTTITASYATGNADGGNGHNDRVGGLVGHNHSGTITASYARGNADGRGGDVDKVGGLVGWNEGGIITASYATGIADGGAGTYDRVGGLVGENNSTITASYATGNVNGGASNNDDVGGLVGHNNAATITASYATGNADGGDGTGDLVGAFAGSNSGSTITASYAFGTVTGGEVTTVTISSVTYTTHNGSPIPPGVTSSYGLTATNAGASWNSVPGGTAGAWNFGTTSQNPALVYADYDGSGNTYNCDNYPDEIPGTTITLRCGGC